jgi:DNA-binding transcriptional LysR family regulator
MNITFRQLRAFSAVAAFGSFTRASEQLHLTQSAISNLVRELEAELGIRLFDRTTRRVELTHAGREFRGSAEKLIADLDHTARNTHELVERKRGRLIVAAPPFLAASLLPQVMAAFRRDFPGISVVLLDVPTDQIVARVTSGEADIGVGTFTTEDEGLTRTPIARDTLMLFCPRGHPLASRRRPRWRDLKGYPVITLTRESGIRPLVMHGFDAAGIAVQPAYEVWQITSALGLVDAELGVGVLPAYATTTSRFLRVTARPLHGPSVSRDVEVIARRGRSLPPATDEFIGLLKRRSRAGVGAAPAAAAKAPASAR